MSEWSSAPTIEAIAAGDEQAKAQLRAYLQRFGYLDRSRDPDEFTTTIDVPAALATLQFYASLPISGSFDDATAEAIKKPRCGFPDTDGIANFVLHGSKWNKVEITWRLENSSPDLPLQTVKKALRASFAEWDRYMPHNHFRELATGTADIMIKFARRAHGDSSPFDGPGSVLAHGFFPPPNSGLLAGDIHFDEDETWNELFLQAVALHEIGHSLGFRHSTDTRAVMYAYFTPGRVTLQTDDIAGVRRLYP